MLNAASKAYLYRPEDTDLGPTFNAMRLRQRTIEWAIMQHIAYYAGLIVGAEQRFGS